MTDDVLITERHGHVALLRLNRPERLNALSEPLIGALRVGLDAAVDDAGIVALVITGAGRAFCAGGDLEMLTAWQDLTARERRMRYVDAAALALRLAELPIPVVAAVNGPAAGAGFDLALAADLCLAARSATFMSGFVGMGLVPDLGGTWWLPRMIGMSRARRLVLGGERLDATTACTWGIAERVVEEDRLIDEAIDAAAKLASLGTPPAYSEAKLALLASTQSLADSLAQTALAQSLLMDTPEHKQRVQQFLAPAR